MIDKMHDWDESNILESRNSILLEVFLDNSVQMLNI